MKNPNKRSRKQLKFIENLHQYLLDNKVTVRGELTFEFDDGSKFETFSRLGCSAPDGEFCHEADIMVIKQDRPKIKEHYYFDKGKIKSYF